jgi:hypothetical protein
MRGSEGQLAESDRKDAVAKPYRTGLARVLLPRLVLYTNPILLLVYKPTSTVCEGLDV